MTTSGYHLVDDIPYYIAIVAAVWRLLTQVIDIAVAAIVAIVLVDNGDAPPN